MGGSLLPEDLNMSWFGFGKKKGAAEEGGEEDEGKDNYDFQELEHLYDFDGQGAVGTLITQYKETKGIFPLMFEFGTTKLGPKGEPLDSEPMGLVMGNASDLVQWAMDPAKTHGGGPGPYP